MRPLLPALSRVESPEEIYRTRYIIAITVTLAVVLELVDTSIVIVAIPHMMGSLGATLDEIAWVSTGYVVANVIVMPISSWLANWFGRRNYFAMSIMLFTASSFMCGNASTLGELVFWRIVQGLGGGGLITTAQAVLYESFPPKEAGTSMAIFGLGVMTGPMLGPTLGGYITDVASWPWIFYINIPLGVLALLLALMYVPDSKFGEKAEEIDFLGLFLLAVGIGTLQTLLERGEKLDWWASREIITYACLSVTALTAFVYHELRHPHPIVDLRVIADPQFAVSLVLAFLLGVTMFTAIFLFPVYTQTLVGFGAWDTGKAIFPGALAAGVTMGVLGRLMPKINIDLRYIVLAGALIFGCSMLLHGQLTTQSGADDFLWPQITRGIGTGMAFMPLNNLAMGNLAPEKIAAGSGLYNLLRQLGGSVGIAGSATLFAQFQVSNRDVLRYHISEISAATMERLHVLKGIFLARGVPDEAAQAKAYALLDMMVRKQAAMLAFEKIFLITGILLIAATPLMLLMKRTHFSRQEDNQSH